jgi:hypothetical protein
LVAVGGCSGQSDVPTTEKNSIYMGSGDTAADKIGAQMAAGHRVMERSKGK